MPHNAAPSQADALAAAALCPPWANNRALMSALIFQIILETINSLVLSGFAGLNLCSYAPHLNPQEASQPQDRCQRSTGLNPFCKHGWGNCHGHSAGGERVPRRRTPILWHR